MTAVYFVGYLRARYSNQVTSARLALRQADGRALPALAGAQLRLCLLPRRQPCRTGNTSARFAPCSGIAARLIPLVKKHCKNSGGGLKVLFPAGTGRGGGDPGAVVSPGALLGGQEPLAGAKSSWKSPQIFAGCLLPVRQRAFFVVPSAFPPPKQ